MENYRRSFPSRCFDRKSARRVSFFTFGFYQSTVPNVIASRKHSFLKTLPFERKKKKKKELIFIDNSRVATTRFSINNRSKNICAIVFLSLSFFSQTRVNSFLPLERFSSSGKTQFNSIESSREEKRAFLTNQLKRNA